MIYLAWQMKYIHKYNFPIMHPFIHCV